MSRRRRFDCVAIDPSVKSEQNLVHLLPFLPVPVVPTLIPFSLLPSLYISLHCSICLCLDIRYIIMAGPKPKASTDMTI